MEAALRDAAPPIKDQLLPMSSRILIVRLSAFGDVIHVLPALGALRKALPDAFIGWIVEDRVAGLLEGHPEIDALHVIPRSDWKKERLKTLTGPMRALAGELRVTGYDTAIDFQGLTKSAIWTRVCGAKRRIGYKGEDARELSALSYNVRVSPGPQCVHVVDRNLSLLEPLDIEKPEVEFHVHQSPDLLRWAETFWADTSDRYPRIVLNPGAGWKTKQWPAASYGRLARALVDEVEARVALAWGPGEEKLVQTALEAVGEKGDAFADAGDAPIGSDPGIYALPRTNLGQLSSIIALAHLFVGGDTGPTHLAAAHGVPTLGIYGASDPRRNGPYGDRVQVIQLAEPSCIPCWKTRCEWAEPLACLTAIGVAQVRERCLKLLEG